MRILAVSHPCVTDVNQQFYAELERLGHQVHLIVPANFRTEYAKAEVARWPSYEGTIEQRKVVLSRSIPLHFYPSNLRTSMERFRPDVLFAEEEPYSASAWQAFYASRGLKMKRVVYSAQNIYKRYPGPFRHMERYVLAKADLAAVVNREVEAVLRRKRYEGRTIAFPLGVDTEQFRPLPEARTMLRTELGLRDRFVVGYVGRLVEEKGIQTLIDAIPELAEKKAALLIIGSGPMMEPLKKIREKHPEAVILADHVKHREVHRWMNAMDALALPSLTTPTWKEQFGRVVIEAMACRVPVIGSDSGEIPTLIRETGGGWVFPEEDANAFVQLAERLMQDKEELERKADQGSRSVQAKYSKRSLARSFEEGLMPAAFASESGTASGSGIARLVT